MVLLYNCAHTRMQGANNLQVILLHSQKFEVPSDLVYEVHRRRANSKYCERPRRDLRSPAV